MSVICPRCLRPDCLSLVDHRHAGRCTPAPDETPLYALVAKALPVGAVLTIADLLRRKTKNP